MSIRATKRVKLHDNKSVSDRKQKSFGLDLPQSNILASLPEDLVCRLTNFLDARTLVAFGATCRSFHDLSQKNAAGWDNLCEVLWRSKVHVCAAARAHPSRKESYLRSIRDAQTRQSITIDELCYDIETRRGTIWSFRFKESAGDEWTNLDPWYYGQPCRKMVFLKDGTVQEFSGNTNRDNSNDSHDRMSAAPQLAPPLFDFGFERLAADNHPVPFLAAHGREGPRVRVGNDAVENLIDRPVNMTWRFLSRPMDLPPRPNGSYLRFNVGGRDVPTYVIRRSPTGNWGFVMESCWGLYGSFELPPQRISSAVRAVSPPGSTSNAHRQGEIEDGSDANDWNISYYTTRASVPAQPLQDDSTLLVTNEIQWREAFLYNAGAHILPEGDEATTHFDRALAEH